MRLSTGIQHVNAVQLVREAVAVACEQSHQLVLETQECTERLQRRAFVLLSTGIQHLHAVQLVREAVAVACEQAGRPVQSGLERLEFVGVVSPKLSSPLSSAPSSG